MLVLSRKLGESILINDNVKIVIVKTGNNVRIGIEAPDDVKVIRGELKDRQQDQSSLASHASIQVN